ncbi:SCO2521 family protein [Nocardia sp. NPDC003482]
MNAVTDRTVAPSSVVLGHIRTCLLPSPNVVDTDAAVELLSAVRQGSPVFSRERPVPLVISADCAEGVDCELPVRSGRTVRGIGTVLTRALVVGGRILQSSSRTRVVAAENSNPRPWPYYLAKVGTVEALSGVDADLGARLAVGYLKGGPSDRLDLASISGRMATDLRMDTQLEHAVPFRAAETQLRWAAEVVTGDERPFAFAFSMDSDTLRSVRIRIGEDGFEAAQRFCEDLAVHDWLLTTLTNLLATADCYGYVKHDPVTILAPVLEQIVPLWMPGAHTPGRLESLWQEVEDDPGFSRQWSSRVNQLRDRMATATYDLLCKSKIGNSEW